MNKDITCESVIVWIFTLRLACYFNCTAVCAEMEIIMGLNSSIEFASSEKIRTRQESMKIFVSIKVEHERSYRNHQLPKHKTVQLKVAFAIAVFSGCI